MKNLVSVDFQVDKSSAQQLCQKAEAEVKTLKENQALDFERIGLLSDENAALQVRNHKHCFIVMVALAVPENCR